MTTDGTGHAKTQQNTSQYSTAWAQLKKSFTAPPVSAVIPGLALFTRVISAATPRCVPIPGVTCRPEKQIISSLLVRSPLLPLLQQALSDQIEDKPAVQWFFPAVLYFRCVAEDCIFDSETILYVRSKPTQHTALALPSSHCPLRAGARTSPGLLSQPKACFLLQNLSVGRRGTIPCVRDTSYEAEKPEKHLRSGFRDALCAFGKTQEPGDSFLSLQHLPGGVGGTELTLLKATRVLRLPGLADPADVSHAANLSGDVTTGPVYCQAAQIIPREYNTVDTTVTSPVVHRLTVPCRIKFKFLGLAFHPLYRLAVVSPFPTSSFCHLMQFAHEDDGFSSGIHILGASLM
ncbi:hypothetical protein ACRRTK_009688 [Alexandromys fortis]